MSDENKVQLQALHKLADYLARRDHSELELREKLSQKFENEHVEWALNEANNQGWLSDPMELAERVTLSLHQKKKGFRFICQYLKKKGLPSLSKDEDIELKKATELINQKFPDLESLNFQDKQKAKQFLANRGFDHETIQSLIS